MNYRMELLTLYKIVAAKTSKPVSIDTRRTRAAILEDNKTAKRSGFLSTLGIGRPRATLAIRRK